MKYENSSAEQNGFRPNVGNRVAGNSMKNKSVRALHDAFVLVAQQAGEDNKGKDGLVGYLRQIAKKDPKAFIGLWMRVLPLREADERPVINVALDLSKPINLSIDELKMLEQSLTDPGSRVPHGDPSEYERTLNSNSSRTGRKQN